jgi:GH18 family chitinase
MAICLGEGNPPFPSAINGTECGPQVFGTLIPPVGADWEKMNPCPLNACCNISGYCGISAEYCAPQVNNTGCISNCGTDIPRSPAPRSWMSVGYFQANNLTQLKCLNMDVTAIDKNEYTHIHYAFADVTQNFKISINSTLEEFQKFSKMTGFNRILSIGGWEFSFNENTRMILREGITATNRTKLADNIAGLVKEYDLDGIDIDWEPEFDGMPSARKDAGADYLAFLQLLKGMVPGKSLSIIVPGAFWFLKDFPIKEISEVVDYISYISYDLHGKYALHAENECFFMA